MHEFRRQLAESVVCDTGSGCLQFCRELYNLAQDRCEMEDLATRYPERVRAMAWDWDAWNRRTGVIYGDAYP